MRAWFQRLAVLVGEQHDLAVGADASLAARVVQQHQREQAERLRLVGHQHGEQLREPDRLVAELVADRRAAAARGVALVEDEVEDGEHRAQPLGQQVVGRDAERDARVADLLLCAHEPLRHRRLGDEERVRDLGRRQAGDLAQRQRDPRLGRERGMAAGEDEREPVVGDRAHVVLLGRKGLEPRQQLGLAGERLLAAQPVDRTVARGRDDPRARASTGVPSRGQRSSAVVKASCTASSASWMSPRTRVSAATARPHSSRKTRPRSGVNAR